MKPSRLALTKKKNVMKWYHRYFNQSWLPIHPKTGLQLFPPGHLHKNINKPKKYRLTALGGEMLPAFTDHLASYELNSNLSSM